MGDVTCQGCRQRPATTKTARGTPVCDRCNEVLQDAARLEAEGMGRAVIQRLLRIRARENPDG